MNVNRKTGNIVHPSFVANLPNVGFAMAFDNSGNLWLCDTDRIVEYDPSGAVVRTITNPSVFSEIFVDAFNPAFSTLYAGDDVTGKVFRYDLSGNLQGTFDAGSRVFGLSVAGTVLPGTG